MVLPIACECLHPAVDLFAPPPAPSYNSTMFAVANRTILVDLYGDHYTFNATSRALVRWRSLFPHTHTHTHAPLSPFALTMCPVFPDDGLWLNALAHTPPHSFPRPPAFCSGPRLCGRRGKPWSVDAKQHVRPHTHPPPRSSFTCFACTFYPHPRGVTPDTKVCVQVHGAPACPDTRRDPDTPCLRLPV
jgi:hypothetical protein